MEVLVTAQLARAACAVYKRWRMLSGIRPAFSALMVVSSLSASAHASQLVWTAAAPCPTQQTVEEMLSERVGQDYQAVGDFHFQAEVSQVTADRWQLELRFEQASAPSGWEERRIEGETCSSVAEAGVVVMALALEREERVAEPVEPMVEPTPGEAATSRAGAPPSPRRSEKPVQPVRETASPVELGMGALALVDSGALPEVAFGAEFGGQLKVSRLVARAAAFGFPRVRHDVADGRGGEFQLFGAALAACYLVRELPLAALGCAGFEAGALLGEGYGTELPKSKASLWLGPTLDVGASARLAVGVALTLRLGLVLPLNRESFVLEEDEIVHQPNEVTLRGGLGVSFFTE